MSSSRYHEVHVDPQGPDDARPSALQIVENEGLLGELGDKVMLITGCSSGMFLSQGIGTETSDYGIYGGIGIETARALHKTGARLFLTVRDMHKGQRVVDSIFASNASDWAGMSLIEMELDSLDSVRAGATDFLRQSPQLNVLINNAGMMATAEGHTRDGFENQFGTNYLGHFLLFQLLKPTLLASSTSSFHSRVVSVSPIGHRQSGIRFDDFNFEKVAYEPWAAYGQAKTANIYLANEIERRYGKMGLHGLSLHHGSIYTNLQSHLPAESIESWITPATRAYMKSPAQGAPTSVYAAISRDWEGRGGRYLSNCEEVGPYRGEGAVADGTDGDEGYAPHAYDEAAESKLWRESLSMLGLEDDQ